MKFHRWIEDHWDEPDKILNNITAENAKEISLCGNLPIHRVLSGHPLLYHSSRFQNGHLRIVEKLLTLYPEGAKHRNKNNLQLPIHCIHRSHYDNSGAIIQATKLILEAYPEALSVQTKDGELPLRHSKWMYQYLTEYLIDNFPQWVKIKDGQGFLPIHHAVEFHEIEAFRLCYTAFPEGLKSKTKLGSLPIHFAALQDIAQLLIAMDPDSAIVQNHNGDLPLHMAANNTSCQDHAMKAIFDAYPEGAKMANKAGNLPIHLVKNSAYAVRLLLDAYPEGVKVQNHTGDLPLHMAISGGECSGEEIKIFFDAYPEGATISNETGNLPLHLVARNSRSYVAGDYAERHNVLRSLLDKYPEGNAVKNKEGLSPINIATDESVIITIAGANHGAFRMNPEGSYKEYPIMRYLSQCPNIARKRFAVLDKMFALAHSAAKDDAERTKSLEGDLIVARNEICDLEMECADVETLLRQQQQQIHWGNYSSSSQSSSQQDIAKYEDRIQQLEAQLQAHQTQLNEAKERETKVRMMERIFIRNVYQEKNNEHHRCPLSLKELKELMASLDSRVTQLRGILKPAIAAGEGNKPSKTQKVVALLWKLNEKGIEMDRVDVVDSISDLNKELLGLEERMEIATFVRMEEDEEDEDVDIDAAAPPNVEAVAISNDRARVCNESMINDDARASKRARVIRVSPYH